MSESAIQKPQVYPATYRAPLGSRIRPALTAAPLYLLAVFGRAHLNSTSPLWLWVGATLGLISIVVGFLSLGSCKITLYPDRIEKKSLFGTKVMRRDEVGKIIKLPRGLTRLNYKYNSGDGMVMPKGIGGDAAWNAWLDATNKI